MREHHKEVDNDVYSNPKNTTNPPHHRVSKPNTLPANYNYPPDNKAYYHPEIPPDIIYPDYDYSSNRNNSLNGYTQDTSNNKSLPVNNPEYFGVKNPTKANSSDPTPYDNPNADRLIKKKLQNDYKALLDKQAEEKRKMDQDKLRVSIIIFQIIPIKITNFTYYIHMFLKKI